MRKIIAFFLLLSLCGCGATINKAPDVKKETAEEKAEKEAWNDTGPSRAFNSDPFSIFTRPYSIWDTYQN
ncbi:hypothetical protein [Aneurinibacillus terranovensis]|uniref:hypothetical protein n=1 Tax=Aneurinibacillus terranovensis TaxID=278991 RepID=UPI0003F7E980|nr:hypothetical protein [Aneurinibacillus terranovensis]